MGSPGLKMEDYYIFVSSLSLTVPLVFWANQEPKSGYVPATTTEFLSARLTFEFALDLSQIVFY